MGQPSRYWVYIGLESSGELRTITSSPAETFFRQEFADLADQQEVIDRSIQNHLSRWLHSENASLQRHAELCLRCFISHTLRDCCARFTKRYGRHYNFQSRDIWPLVLDSTYKFRRLSTKWDDDNALSLATQILKNFDSTKSSLSTWIHKHFTCAPEIKWFSGERGFEQISDWLLLKQTSTKRLSQILSELFLQTPMEIKPQVELLEAFHTVYCTDIEQRPLSKSPYPTPTPEQLERMATLLSSHHLVNANDILQRLRELAQKIRCYRNHKFGDIMPSLSLDQFPNTSDIKVSKIEPLVPITSKERGREIAQIIEKYCNSHLPKVVAMVIDHRIKVCGGKRSGDKKVKTFLRALELFYCQSLPQKEIAEAIGLQNQTAVSRLLGLKNLYADISRNLLDCLTQDISALAKTRRDPEQLRSAIQQISLFLQPHIEELVHQAIQEGFTNRNREMKCPLSRAICDYLYTRKKEDDNQPI